MKILVLGATGATGLDIVGCALDRNHSVTAFVRKKDALARFDGNVNVIEGNLLDRAELAHYIAGQDAVLSAFGPRDPKSHEPLVTQFAQALVPAMLECRVDRLIMLSVAFLFRNSILPPAYLAGQLLFKRHVEDCANMEELLQRSPLNWTIVRPPALTNKSASTKYRVGVDRLPFMGFTASRANVADFMIGAMESASYSRQIVGIAD